MFGHGPELSMTFTPFGLGPSAGGPANMVVRSTEHRDGVAPSRVAGLVFVDEYVGSVVRDLADALADPAPMVAEPLPCQLGALATTNVCLRARVGDVARWLPLIRERRGVSRCRLPETAWLLHPRRRQREAGEFDSHISWQLRAWRTRTAR